MSVLADVLAYLENQGITDANGDTTAWQGQIGLESKLKYGRDRMIMIELLPEPSPGEHVTTARTARVRLVVRDKQHAYSSCHTKFLEIFDALQDQEDALNADAEVGEQYQRFQADQNAPIESTDMKNRPNMAMIFTVRYAK